MNPKQRGGRSPPPLQQQAMCRQWCHPHYCHFSFVEAMASSFQEWRFHFWMWCFLPQQLITGCTSCQVAVSLPSCLVWVPSPQFLLPCCLIRGSPKARRMLPLPRPSPVLSHQREPYSRMDVAFALPIPCAVSSKRALQPDRCRLCLAHIS